MPLKLLADPDPLSLLRFWEEQRGGRPVPVWTDDISLLPVRLLPNIAITERRPHSVFRYLGSECLRRWGGGVTGAAVYEEVITGPHGAYLRSVGDDAIARRRPVFSTANYELADGKRLDMARLYAPFAQRDEGVPRVVAGLQILRAGDGDLIDLKRARLREEVDRRLIADPTRLLDRLDAMRRATALPIAAQEVLATLRALDGSAIVTLTRHSGPPR